MSAGTASKFSNMSSDEKIIHFMTETTGDKIGQVMKLLGRTAEEQCLASAYCAATYSYIVYEVLREEFGPEKGSRIAVAVPFGFGGWAMKVALRQMGLKDTKEIKDIPAMAKLFQRVMNTFGNPCVITESSNDRGVFDMIFCHNPMLGPAPWDRYIDRVRYYKDTDSSYEIGYGKFCSEFPNMCGLGDKVEGRLTHIMCLAEGPTCRTVFQRKK